MATVESLIAEAASFSLYIQSLCENYWNKHEPRWTCWLRYHDGTSATSQTQMGSGETAAMAISSALNARPSTEPPIEFTSYDTPNLDKILNLTKSNFVLSIKRRTIPADDIR